MHKFADLIVEGALYTVNPPQPWAQALAVRAGRIVAMGTRSEVHSWAGPLTRRLSFDRGMVMPGLIDAHCHPTKGAIANLFSCKFAFDATPDAIANSIRASLARAPTACLIGGRWASDFFSQYQIPSPRAWLDAIGGEVAIYLRDDSGHNGWASSRALALAGVTRNTPDPASGRIQRDASGEPNGLLFEAADSLVRNRLPDWSAAQYREGVREMLRIAHGFGITGINDADANEPLLRAYHEADLADELTMHVAASLSTPYGHRRAPLDYAHFDALRALYASKHVDTNFIKIYQDGVPTSARTAAMLAPYAPHPDFPADFRGELHVDEATLATDVAALEARGFTVKLHTAGDRSLRVSLDAIEYAHRQSGRCDLRHELAHAGFVDHTDFPRLKALNAVADLSPYLWYPSPIINSVINAVGERGRFYWPIRTLIDAGINLLAGSDWPAAVASMDPWIGIQTLVTRRDPQARTPGALWEEQAITLAEALKIFTLDGARALRREALTGTLEVGKSADFIVLNQNLFSVPASEIVTTQVERTFFEGQEVYRRAT